MTDGDLRGILLRKFYDLRRRDRPVRLELEDLGEIEFIDYNRIGRQLGDLGLLDWHAYIGVSGSGKITTRGVQVIEGDIRAPVEINLTDRSISVHGSQNVQIGNSNTLTANIDVRNVLSAIDKADATDEEKEEARGLFMRLFNSPTFASIAGAIIGMGGGSAGG